MELEEFKAALKAHDWHFAKSDSAKVYRAGKENEDRLTTIASNHGEIYQKVMIAHCAKAHKA